VNQVNQVNSPKLPYRAEIDGLRAIAVISVILYHAQMVLFGRDWFEGGFIGVDIFFVISGYLITRIILSELESKGSFSFLNFYERRARRILPMLFVVIFVSVPYAWQKLLPSDFIEYAESILASLFFGSNFFFYFSTTEYGADSALLKPFLHTWSLGVEEQFYLVFPILAIVAFKYFRKHFLTILVGLSLLSLQFAELMEVRNSDLNFYFPFSRFWELAIGSMLAYRELYYKPSNESIASKSLPILGLYLIAYSILFFDAKTPHPSFHTLIPIIGVALVIGFASQDELVGKVLGTKPFVWVGLISYSAYLWHFPIFAFYRMGKEPTNYDKFEWVVLTVLLSVISYFLVERTFRRTLSKRVFLLSALLACISSAFFCYQIIINDGFKDRLPKIIDENFDQQTWNLLTDEKGVCFNRSDDFCFFAEGASGEKTLLVLYGDSHVGSLSFDLVRRLNASIAVLDTTSVCQQHFKANLTKINNGAIHQPCTSTRNDKIFELVEDFMVKGYKIVFLFGGRSNVMLNESFFDNLEGGVERREFEYRYLSENGYADYQRIFSKTVEKITAISDRLILLYPIPEVGWDVPSKIMQKISNGKDLNEISKSIVNQPITTSYDVFKDRSLLSFTLLDSFDLPSIGRVKPHEYFCDTFIKNRCVTHDSSNIFYADDDHPSLKGAEKINDMVLDALLKF